LPESKSIKVMIVDDHPVVRTGLISMLHAFDDLELVGEAGSGTEALAKCQDSLPDVLLLGWNLPDQSMTDLFVDLLALDGRPKIIVLSVRPEDEGAAMAAGADAYVTKDAPPDRLMALLQTGKDDNNPNAV
jgi:DNA-binding NarL/FixJ family response regulator